MRLLMLRTDALTESVFGTIQDLQNDTKIVLNRRNIDEHNASKNPQDYVVLVRPQHGHYQDDRMASNDDGIE